MAKTQRPTAKPPKGKEKEKETNDNSYFLAPEIWQHHTITTYTLKISSCVHTFSNRILTFISSVLMFTSYIHTLSNGGLTFISSIHTVYLDFTRFHQSSHVVT